MNIQIEFTRARSLFVLGLALLVSGNALAQSAVRPGEWRYTIAKGDMLISLAARLLNPATEWQKLQKLNNIANPDVLSPGAVLRIPVEWLRGDVSVATVQQVQGAVAARRILTPLPTPVAGTTLLPGDRIETGPQSSLTLRFVDGSQIVVAPDSKVLIEKLLVYGKTGITETRLKIEEGAVDSKVVPMANAASRYTVNTPVFNLGVRGTDFRARYDAKSQMAFSEVLEGGVAAEGKSSQVKIDAGFGTLALINTEPKHPVKLPAAPLLRELSTISDQIPMGLKWAPEDGVKAFRAKIFASNEPDRLLLEGVFAQPAASWPDLPDGAYVVSVRSIDADGLEGQSSSRNFVRKARPTAPLVNQPANASTVYGDEVTFQWSQSAVAEKYRIQVSDTADFKKPQIDRTDVTGPEQKLALSPGNYFWRIATVAKGNDQGPFSAGFGFVQRKIPESPGSVEATLDNGTDMVFRWKAVDPGHTFQYQVSPDPRFELLYLDKSTSTANTSFAKPPPGTYYIRLKTIDASGFAGPFGAAQKFIIEEPATPWLKVLPVMLMLVL